LRNELKKRMEAERLSQRDIQELTGVSFATISRYLRGNEITHANHHRIRAWLTGEPLKPVKPVCSRRFKVGPLTFLVTVELLTGKSDSREVEK